MPYTIEYTGEWTGPLEALIAAVPQGEDWHLTFTMRDGTVHDVTPLDLVPIHAERGGPGSHDLVVQPWDVTTGAPREDADTFVLALDKVARVSL